jgi:uncharacterized lipoprotein YddW (UPF0748 family)
MLVAYGLDATNERFQDKDPQSVGRTLKEQGIGAVFLKTLSAPWVEGLHEAELQVYASQAVFVDQAELWQRLPDCRPVTATGEAAPQQEWYRPIRPTSPEVQRLRLKEIERLLTSLPLDGIWLDFIRWPARWEGASPELYDSSFDRFTIVDFREDTGLDAALDAPEDDPAEAARVLLNGLREEWFDWRCTQITRFAREAAERIRSLRPGCRVGIFSVPWTGDPTVDELTLDGSPLDDAPRRIVGQDVDALGKIVDVISPMVYHRLCGRPISWIEDVVTRVSAKTDAQVWPVIEAIDPPEQYPLDEFARAHKRAADGGSGSTIVFKLDGLLADPARIAALRP